MRLFIAIELPEYIKQRMAEVQGRIKDTGVSASWTRPEGIHLTLKFLGEVAEEKIAAMMTALSNALKEVKAFQIEVAEAGAFPNVRKPRVIWLGIAGEIEALKKLQMSVETEMKTFGFEPEERKFSPHLTLARIKFPRSRDNWQKALESVKDIKFSPFLADHVSLMKSELRSSGAVYTEIGRIELK